VQDREFRDTAFLLFDGESGLRSKDVQEKIYQKCNIIVYADPLWKRSLAERAIREIKLRMAIHLDFQGKICIYCTPLLPEYHWVMPRCKTVLGCYKQTGSDNSRNFVQLTLKTNF